MTTTNYITYTMIMKHIKSYPVFIYCVIDNNIVTCDNKSIKDHITKHLKDLTILHLSFYVFYPGKTSTYFINTLNILPFNLLPVYKLEDDFKTFVKKFIKFSNIDIHAYDTKHHEKIDQSKYLNKDDCLAIERSNTNPEFPNFTQYVFHAGNEYQLNRYGMILAQSLFNYSNVSERIPTNIYYGMNSIINTVSYLYNYLKKGIMVGIKKNKLAIFLPFTNTNYTNDFYEELYFNSKDKEQLQQLKREPNNTKLLKILEDTTKEYFRKYRQTSKDVIWDRRKWYANGCFFRNDTYDGDKLVTVVQDMFTELCKNRILNDCIFMVNVRDFPLLRKDRKHPYTYITDKKIPEKFLKPFCPILSLSTSIYYDDIPMITNDDWFRVSKKFFPEACANNYINPSSQTPWENKKNIAIFRGAASGCGIDISNNMRLKLISIAKKHPELFNVGLTSFNKRIKKQKNGAVKIIDFSQYEKASFVTDDEKLTYKYIINIDGHVTAFRLGNELQSNSVLLLVQSHYYIWVSTFLKPYEHYIPIECNLSDLVEKILWCQNNDEKCKIIAQNAKDIYNKYLTREGAMDYMQNIINKFVLIREPEIIKNKAKKIGIVLCYRDNKEHTRYNEILFYNYVVSKMLINANVDFRMIIVEQTEKDKFNIGTLKNIGFLYLSEKEPDIDYFIFTDIDMIPDCDLFPYFYTVTDGITMFATRGTRYKNYINDAFMGGCIGCTSSVFKKVNGYSNTFTRGWGGEDENLYIRCTLEKIILYRPPGFILDIEVNVNGTRKFIVDKLNQEKATKNYDDKKFEQLCNYESYLEDGLNNMTYDVLFENYNNNIYHIIVDVKHTEHERLYKHHFNYDKFTMEKYEQYKVFKSNLRPRVVNI